MNERPILFSTEMVKAILDGRKTQTRRVINKQPLDILPMIDCANDGWVTLDSKNPNHGSIIKCRYGQPGDHLWVRETFGVIQYDQTVIYKADCDDEALDIARDYLKWRPSIHMPRWASRLNLEVKSVRAERVQDISEADAFDEGIDTESETYAIAENNQNAGVSGCGNVVYSRSYYPSICCFRNLWDSINAKPKPVLIDKKIDHYVSYPWETGTRVETYKGLPHYIFGNPWVWAVEFTPTA